MGILKKRVLMAMSGGLDSSVAAMILLNQGYELTGITFRSYDSISQACIEKQTGCCNADTLFEAAQLAKKLGFEHRIIDVRDVFKETVIKNFTEEYLAGRTPNPCVLCNKIIKWGVLMDEANNEGCDYIATGHYAQIGCVNEQHFIQKGADNLKDQSYFLWRLRGEVLSKTLFPLGSLTKKEVREIAQSYGFSKIAEKRESQEVCFIPDNNYRRFLTENTDSLPGEGYFRDVNGKIIGTHKGYPFYTIGQRKGLNVALGHPVFVISIDVSSNTVVLGSKENLVAKSARIENTVFNKTYLTKKILTVKIRYRTPGIKAIVHRSSSETMVEFIEDALAVAPGQSAVIYDGNDLIGGGIITKID